MIEVKGIDVFYGGIQALKGVTLSVNAGEVVALIGNNGAGKSTLFKAILGLLPKRSGDIYFDEHCITTLPAAEIIRLGIGVVPEGRRLFGPLSVTDNLLLGAFLRLQKRGEKQQVQKDLEDVFEIFPRLRERSRQSAGTLSGGEQQMLAIGRALIARPKAIFMDEPSIGLAPLIVQEIFAVIGRIKEQGHTILLIEQNASLALEIADKAHVMELGRIVMGGTAEELLQGDVVQKLYLGS